MRQKSTFLKEQNDLLSQQINLLTEQNNIESTSEFIKKHLEQIQRSRAELTKQNQQLEYRERNPAGLDPGYEIRTFKTRTGQLFGAVTASISKQCADAITDAINESIKSTGFKQRCQRFSEDRIETHSFEYQHTADRSQERTLENLASEGTRQLLQRSKDAEQANRHARGDSGNISQINQQLGGLEKTVAEIRLKPKPTTDFISIYCAMTIITPTMFFITKNYVMNSNKPSITRTHYY
jgi:hypothetical protein